MDEKRATDFRDGIVDADATGMVAGEELITEAETLLPLLPHDDLHAALPSDHQAHSAIDELHAQIQAAAPDRGAIERHVGHLRSLPELEAIVATWWEDPKTQRFVGNLGQIGL